MNFTPEKIAELRKLKGEGMISVVGQYTPDEFWAALDEIESLRDAIVVTMTILQLASKLFDAALALDAKLPKDSRTLASYHARDELLAFRGVLVAIEAIS